MEAFSAPSDPALAPPIIISLQYLQAPIHLLPQYLRACSNVSRVLHKGAKQHNLEFHVAPHLCSPPHSQAPHCCFFHSVTSHSLFSGRTGPFTPHRAIPSALPKTQGPPERELSGSDCLASLQPVTLTMPFLDVPSPGYHVSISPGFPK